MSAAPRLSRVPAARLSPADLVDRIRDRANRIEYLGSSHSNMARALAKDALALADYVERDIWRFPQPERAVVPPKEPPRHAELRAAAEVACMSDEGWVFQINDAPQAVLDVLAEVAVLRDTLTEKASEGCECREDFTADLRCAPCFAAATLAALSTPASPLPAVLRPGDSGFDRVADTLGGAAGSGAEGETP